eukprot:CAMPEP_0194484928 /NCGR_PEP_ID=MMETSP0253-20130528/6093_1 /TAXON_ID=2966 /ORGANISM="Noctiluca scintillans" /LENGTH=44 /DNA_ID= /DNA_START= /DNA_END= /DNA_ORIENTATION=
MSGQLDGGCFCGMCVLRPLVATLDAIVTFTATMQHPEGDLNTCL